ncbi:helix-turn-helix domain-containing protein [Sphingobium sufflavum]|uniref:IclR family transcriptional regulator n=1 Tax=Sphingobium sufflavum TaxID=1129547 RepID=UPI001F189635|nr:MarR family transcriptional regulator [Sphingobium sufflavum]MCE7795222.1 helix-turn-helix domain-containing protein [Sphingobium sufflavum]
MSRSSPGVGRVVSILNFISDHPGQSFTLTDIVRALRLSRATCHALLGGLVEAGYLFRASDKSYVLGPALIAMGEVAKDSFSPTRVAQPEMRALADKYDAICALCTLEDGDAVILDRAAALSNVGHSTVRGAHLPLLAQYAGVFFVWASTAEVNDWLDTLDPKPRVDQRERMLQSIDFIRSHGFGASQRTAHTPNIVSALDRQASWEMLDQTMEPLLAIDSDGRYWPGYIQAPIYDARRRVAFVIALSGFKGQLTGDEIIALGAEVRETCERLSSFISRVPPATL